MANSGSKSKSKSRSRSSAAQASKSKSTKKNTKSAAASPDRREAWGIICFLLALFSFLGYFDIKALFIDFFCGLVKGLVGWGFYALPPVLALSGIILITRNGKPVGPRVWCTMLLPVVAGAIAHLFACDILFSKDLKLITELYISGVALASGGLIGGLLSVTFSAVFSPIGAAIVFIAAALLLLIFSMDMTVSSIYRAIKNRPRPEPEPDDPGKEDTASALVNKVAGRMQAAAEKKKAVIDIPVEDGPAYQKSPDAPKNEKPAEDKPRLERSSLFNDKPNVRPPDTLLVERLPAVAPDSEQLRLADAQRPVREYRSVRDPRTQASAVPQPDIIAVKDGASRPVSVGSYIPEAAAETLPPAAAAVAAVPAAAVPAAATVAAAAAAAALPKTEQAAEKVTKKDTAKAAEEVALEIAENQPEVKPYQFPPLSLLKSGNGRVVDGTDEMKANRLRLAETIKSFGIEASIINVTRGPSVTRFELELGEGVRLNKLTNLSNDIALALGASGVRIAAIPDRISVVGIEVPNKTVSTVYLHDVIASEAFQTPKSKVAFALGTDIGGRNIVSDITKLPHLLIAGTTGSGKSVCINSILISLLYRATPEEVRLIMIDPKMIELGVYNGLPHLLIPVVTDPKKAAGALQWAVTEMMRRYALMADAGVRDVSSYNKAAAKDETRQPLPQIVIVIDELADLMLAAAKEVEDSICRIAQMARAAGMHLVIATQRPSADVITGIMKANIPSRIAFAVDAAINSRIILDTTGAEKLVGKGDMLYNPLGGGKPVRVQGCFVTDEEIEGVVSFIKKTSTAAYSQEVMDHIEKNAEQSSDGGASSSASAAMAEPKSDEDELLPDAVTVILETGQASVSMLQRRLKLGYARAARIVDAMEEKGIVGPFEGSKPRQILITKEQWQERQMKGGCPAGAPVMQDLFDFDEDGEEE